MNWNDKSANPPKLRMMQSWWGMSGLGNGEREWTVDEKFEKLAEAGFTGIMGRFPAPLPTEQWRRKLDAYGFGLGVHCFVRSRQELREFWEQAREVGPDFVNAQVPDSFVVGEAAERLLRELVDEANGLGIPFFVETHRGRVTQDLHRTVEYAEAIPDLRLTIDLSHYAVAGEWEQLPEQGLELLDRLLRRTSSIHGRVSSGHQVQIDVGPNGEHPMLQAYTRVWARGMAYWLEQAKPGDLLPVLPELGPPGYSITGWKASYDERYELSDRWQQALVIRDALSRAWDEANGTR